MDDSLPHLAADAAKLIFITGVPSAGKTTLSRLLAARLTGFRYLSGDDTVRRLHAAGIPPLKLFPPFLDEVARTARAGDVIVDMSIPYFYMRRAKGRFGTSGPYVALFVSQGDREARDIIREDRAAVDRTAAKTQLTGPPKFYDVAIDTTENTPEQCADMVLAATPDEWRLTFG